MKNLPDDQDAAERILANLGLHELESELNIDGILILHPLVQVASGENNVIQQPSTLGNFRLEARLVQVLCASLNNLLLMVLDATQKVNSAALGLCDARARAILTPSRACGAEQDGTRHRESCAR